MAQVLNVILPSGYTRISGGGPEFDITRTGAPGRWQINQNDPLGVWSFSVSYVRAQYLEDADIDERNRRFDEIYAFFLCLGAASAFLVDDPIDNTASSMGGEGHVEEWDGVMRLVKWYKFGNLVYKHPITRPKNDVVLGGDAADGTLDPETGIVTGTTEVGTWTGGFLRPMIFLSSGLKYESDPSGLIRAFDVPLQENLEV